MEVDNKSCTSSELTTVSELLDDPEHNNYQFIIHGTVSIGRLIGTGELSYPP